MPHRLAVCALLLALSVLAWWLPPVLSSLAALGLQAAALGAAPGAPRKARGAARGGEELPPVPATDDAAAGAAAVGATDAQCVAAMRRLQAAQPAAEWPPPCPLPADSPLRAGFEGPRGSMPISRDYCHASRYDGALVLDWSQGYIDFYCDAMTRGAEVGTYGPLDDSRVRAALDMLPGGVSGLAGMVIGSERPWVECLALQAGAHSVWTLEYATVVSTHPQLFALPARDMAAGHIAGTLPRAFFVVSYSSLEHSGLGRYGDELNPDGDKEAMQQAWCFLQPGGHMILGVAMSCQEDGYIEFNAHRVYGYARLAHIAEGFELFALANKCLPASQDFQAIVIFRKPVNGLRAPMISLAEFAAADRRAEAYTVPVEGAPPPPRTLPRKKRATTKVFRHSL